MKLRPGTEVLLVIQQDKHGFTLQARRRAGGQEARIGKTARCRTEEDLWIELEKMAQTKLAAIGLEKTK